MTTTKPAPKKSRNRKKYPYERAFANVKTALIKLDELRTQLKAK
jgi:hypothetical protein